MKPKLDTKLVKQQLKLIAEHLPTIYFIGLINADGLEVVTWKHGDSEANESDQQREKSKLTAISAASSALGERIISELGAGSDKVIILHGENLTYFNIILGEAYLLSFGIREIQTIDITLDILQQWWQELLNLLEVPAPKL